MNRKTLLVIGTLLGLVIAAICIGLYFLRSDSKLNSYKGSVADLLPREVGRRKLGESGNAGARISRKFQKGFVEDVEATYQTYNGKEPVDIYIANFSSSDYARDALQKLQESDGTHQVKEWSKKKGWQTVGDRLEVCRKSSRGCDIEEIVWTNGSVLFILSDPRMGTTDTDPNYLLEFEENYPY